MDLVKVKLVEFSKKNSFDNFLRSNFHNLTSILMTVVDGDKSQGVVRKCINGRKSLEIESHNVKVTRKIYENSYFLNYSCEG